MTPDNEPIVISSEAKKLAEAIHADWLPVWWNGASCKCETCLENFKVAEARRASIAFEAQQTINSANEIATAPLKAEIERLNKDLIVARASEPIKEWIEDQSDQLHSLSQQNEHLKKELDDQVLITKDSHDAQRVIMAENDSLSQQNEQLEKQLMTMREAINDVLNHKTEDQDGNFVCWIGETSFLLCQSALSSTSADIAKKWVGVEAYKKLKTELEMCDPAYVWDLARQRYIFSGSDPNASVYSNHLADICRKHKEALTLAQKELEKV